MLKAWKTTDNVFNIFIIYKKALIYKKYPHLFTEQIIKLTLTYNNPNLHPTTPTYTPQPPPTPYCPNLHLTVPAYTPQFWPTHPTIKDAN